MTKAAGGVIGCRGVAGECDAAPSP